MISEKETRREERAKLRKQYRVLYDKFSSLLFRYDPIGINFENNTDEYEPEVDTILPRLQSCSSEADCLKVIHEEFCKWFGENIAGSMGQYEALAHEAWIMWNDQKLN